MKNLLITFVLFLSGCSYSMTLSHTENIEPENGQDVKNKTGFVYSKSFKLFE